LGSDKPAAVRLAGVYAMAGLADDWEANRQTCVDVLCAYLRMPYEPDPGPDGSMLEQLAVQSSREVRHTVIRVITAHLKDDTKVSWQGLNFDFTGVVFDGGDFTSAVFSGGTIDFRFARFSGGMVDFRGAKFSGGTVNFSHAGFSGGTVDFSNAEFSGGNVYFYRAQFTGGIVDFHLAGFFGGEVYFGDSVMAYIARTSASTGDYGAQFSGGVVDFRFARFSGSTVDFGGADFSGGTADFSHAGFSGGTVDFSEVDDWSSPPTFTWADTPPPSVKLPDTGGKAS
jgi:Pentapeptide repeats (9 copies)